MLEKFKLIKDMAAARNCTVSICNSFGFDDFNDEARAKRLCFVWELIWRW